MTETQPDMIDMMKHCMRGCHWCALMPFIFGVIAFLLGYFLDAAVVRILWLIASGFMVLMGLMCFLMISKMSKL